MKVAQEALIKVHKALQGKGRILDVGSGEGQHARWFRSKGYEVVTTDIAYDPDYKGDFNKISLSILEKEGEFDCVWCSHVLEHQLNPNGFLKRLKLLAKKETGILAITVPPRKDALVGGHLTLYTPLSLIYGMIMAGIDCNCSSLKVYGYNISILTYNNSVDVGSLPLKYDRGDIETLDPYFPVRVWQNIDGFAYTEIHWQ